MMERVVLAITNRCNLRCRHCYTDGGEPLAGELRLEELKRVIEQVAALGAQRLILSGGEPLAAPERLARCLGWAREAGLRTTVTTNATLITPPKARRLAELRPDTVQVSLDSDLPDEHDLIRGRGSHALAAAGLRAAVEAGLRCTVMMVAFGHNWTGVRRLAAAAAGWGARLLAVDRFVATGRGRAERSLMLTSDDLAGLHQELTLAQHHSPIPVVTNDPIWNALDLAPKVSHDFTWARSAAIGCSAGSGSCVITADGRVLACTFLPVELGRVGLQELGEILSGSRIVAALRNRDGLGGKCGRCRLRLICGGCRAEAWAETGDILGEDPLCSVEDSLCATLASTDGV